MSLIRLYPPQPDLGPDITPDLESWYLLEGGGKSTGVLDTDTAEMWDNATGDGERLWRTPAGQWVITRDVHRGDHYVSVAAARAWLVRNRLRDVVATHIDRDEAGRPEVGPEVKTRLPEDVVAAVDDLAAANGWSRAAALRVLVTDGLSTLGRYPTAA
jgi:hypothetical protein